MCERNLESFFLFVFNSKFADCTEHTVEWKDIERTFKRLYKNQRYVQQRQYCKYSKTWAYNIDINRAVCDMYMDSGANACSKMPKTVGSIKRFECTGSLCGTS